MNADIERALTVLLGQPLQCVRRAAGMQIRSFP
jgi:hypothetical protein